MITDILASGTLAYALVFARMAGLVFNPIYGRKGIPNSVKIVIILGITLVLTPVLPRPAIAGGLPMFVVLFEIIKEFSVGFVFGFVFQLFYYMLLFVGDVMDMQFGLSMAKIFDPGTNIQMSVSGNVLNIIFVMFVFASGSHLTLIRLFTTSYAVVPMGTAVLGPAAGAHFASMFIRVFELALKLALPFVAAELVLEVSMGILMKLIPQIHVFVINIQAKVLLGLLLIILFAGPISSFLDSYILIMLESMQSALFTLV